MRWKMVVNVGKTKVMVTSSSTDDHAWDPGMFTKAKPIESVHDYKFLGVTVSNDLRFNEHLDMTVDRCKKRVDVLKCMANKSWGNPLETQRTLYIQYIRSALEYTSCSWSPWILDTGLKRLQRIQNDALRSIAGWTKTYPWEFLHLETGIEPLEDIFDKNN